MEAAREAGELNCLSAVMSIRVKEGRLWKEWGRETHNIIVCSPVLLENRHGLGDMLDVFSLELFVRHALLTRYEEGAVGDVAGTHLEWSRGITVSFLFLLKCRRRVAI